jgi:TRAP-type C4-dicarboxylate transport system permease large subunit
MRIGFGVLAGVTADVLFGVDSGNGILVGVLFYLATYYIARYAWFRKVESQQVTKLYTTGIGGYVMLFLFVWILLFTLSSSF